MNWLREPDTEPLPGYRLIEPIGSGGFGEVWKCLVPGGIYKAIKFVYGNLHDLDVEDDRARQELKALERVKQVRHPFLLSIEQIQEIDGELIIVMELADQNLHECFLGYQQRGLPGIPREKLLAYLDDAAVGLDFLIDKHGLQHLDIKPRNLFLVADRVKVADFGLVKTLERSSVSGLLGGVTPLYAAPETFANKISKHSDQYSLAIVYVELLTGRRPFEGKNIRQLALQHMTAPPDLSMLPEADRPIVGRALAKEPEQRFPSCTAFVRSLAAVGRAAGWHGSLESFSVGQLSLPSFAQLSLPELPTTLPPPAINGVATLTPSGPTPATSPSPQQSSAALWSDDRHLEATEPQYETGVLRPTLLVGIGSFGRRALQEVRRRLVDRLGDALQLPSIRFLYVDCDPEATRKALAAASDSALHFEEILLMPLQPVTQYRRRQLEQILEWLPREKLYSIPRNLQAGGVRAFGRLAFCDHYLRFVARLKRELHLACHPESLAQTASHCGLNVRDAVPQVLIFASLAGGSGGMLLDLGHAVRRVLQRAVSGEQGRVTAFLYLSAPTDPGSPSQEIANVVAGLTELHHYADSDVVYTAQYGGPDGPQIEVRGLPFTATYLLTMEERSGTAFRRCLTQLASYVCNELTTPLGQALDAHRSRPIAPGRTCFRSFGVCSLWYPRGLLLRSAAQRICAEMLRRWACEEPPNGSASAAAVVARIVQDTRLAPSTLLTHWDTASANTGNAEIEQLRRWLRELEQQWPAAARNGQSSVWARKVWEQTREWVGTRLHSPHESSFLRSRLLRTLENTAQQWAEQWANECWSHLEPLADQPGPRLATVEVAVQEIGLWCAQQAAALEQQTEKLSIDVRQAYTDVQAALDACQDGNGSFSLLGSRSTRTLRHFVEQHRRFVEGRMQEQLHQAAAMFYRLLQSRLQEHLRDVERARHRLREIVQRLQGSTGSEMATETPGRLPSRTTGASAHTGSGERRGSVASLESTESTVCILLPDGQTHWEQAAQHLAERWTATDLLQLEDALNQLVLSPRGGLLSLCRMHADLDYLLTTPLIDQTAAFLAERLPCHDVAEVEISQAQTQRTPLEERMQIYLRRAAPPVGAGDLEEQTFLTAPASSAGRQLAESLRSVAPGSLFVEVPGTTTDILFCREHGGLRLEDLVSLLLGAIPIYQEACSHILTNPHARHDISEWLPLWE